MSKIPTWISSFKEKMGKDKIEIKDLSDKITNLLKGADRVSVVPTVLANIFESLEHTDVVDNMNFENQIMYWGLEHYVTKKVKEIIPSVIALHNYCVDNNYIEDNTWEHGGGDRIVCYIPTTDNKKVLLFENQNVKFVVVLEDSYVTKLHVRKVYDNLFSEKNSDYGFYSGNNYFKDVNELREGIKGDKGLEIALLNLTSEYKQWADSIEGNQYPSRIDLDTMKKANFDKDCSAFKFGDCRDSGYVLSYNLGRCDVRDYHNSNYIFYDIVNAISSIPESYLKAVKRNELLDKLF